jgi:hypothetical protein
MKSDPSEYAPFGTLTVGPPVRPEPARVAPVHLKAAAVVERYGLAAVEDIDTRLKPFGFPAMAGWHGRAVVMTTGGTVGTTQTLYALSKIEEWEDSILQLADHIRTIRRKGR